MRLVHWAAVPALALALAACQPDHQAAAPSPQEPGPGAVGTICRMNLVEHHGPKGQVFVSGTDKPFWFSSVRDMFTWLLVDDGLGTEVAAIYVNDMGRAKNWDNPEPGTWVEAHRALFVVGSNRTAAMGGTELVPFGDRPAAERFVAGHGGRILTFKQVDRNVLAAGEPDGTPAHVHSEEESHHE